MGVGNRRRSGRSRQNCRVVTNFLSRVPTHHVTDRIRSLPSGRRRRCVILNPQPRVAPSAVFGAPAWCQICELARTGTRAGRRPHAHVTKMATDDHLPFMRVPHDTMREGLPGAKAGVTHLGKHPVQIIQEQGPAASALEKRAMLANTYGIAMPARMDIEAQILGRQKRLPGLPSSNFGAEILTNDVDRFGFESYLDNPADRADAPRRELHAAMELKLGMDKTPGYGPGAKR